MRFLLASEILAFGDVTVWEEYLTDQAYWDFYME